MTAVSSSSASLLFFALLCSGLLSACAPSGVAPAPVEDTWTEPDVAVEVPDLGPPDEEPPPNEEPPPDDGPPPDTGPPPECELDDHCDDGNPCTTGVCALYAQCKYIPNGDDCEDDNACTSDERCTGGECVGEAKECDDGLVCTQDFCDEGGECGWAPAPGECDDGTQCTQGDHCDGGACVGGVLKSCDDANACTKDLCNATSGECTNEQLEEGDLCEDGDFCSVGDSCQAGACVPGIPLNCDDGELCTDDSCDNVTGFCTVAYNNVDCDDGNVCTATDMCAGGKCQGQDPTDCNDGNPCTDDPCDPLDGTCSNVANTKPCDDGEPCTLQDQCKKEACKPGNVAACDDNNPCSADFCELGVGTCTYTQLEGTCDDEDKCTLNEVCMEGVCEAGSTITCTDGDPCTLDFCLPKTGKCDFNEPQDGSCDDGDACTLEDACVDGLCDGVSIDCSDDDPCTDPLSEVCTGGECVEKTPTPCDDSNPCTLDLCQSEMEGGCTYSNVLNTTPCDLNSACSSGACQDGACTIADEVSCDDNNPCTVDTCHDTFGCQYGAEDCGIFTIACLDGFCDPVDGCVLETDALFCDDGIACSVDSCEPELGCVHDYPVGCCSTKALIEDFDNGETPSGWQLQNQAGDVGWQVVAGQRSTTGLGSLYYGDPEALNYDGIIGGQSSGAAVSPFIQVPNTAAPVLRFWIWIQTESSLSFDQFFVMIGSTQLADKSVAIQSQWTQVTVPLSAHAGQTVQLRFEFDTTDDVANSTEGVYLDDIQVLGCN